MSAFSYEIKREVKERAGGFISELSGRTDRPPEYMHLYHGRGEKLNDSANCKLVMDMEHLAHHLYWYDRPEEIGLSKKQNIWAIGQITGRVTQFSYNRGLLSQYDEDLSACLGGWAVYYKENESPLFIARAFELLK